MVPPLVASVTDYMARDHSPSAGPPDGIECPMRLSTLAVMTHTSSIPLGSPGPEVEVRLTDRLEHGEQDVGVVRVVVEPIDP